MLSQIQRRLNRWKFKRSTRRLKGADFCIISNTCISGRIYKTLNKQYNTPFVGIMIQPNCFAKLVNDFEAYMDKELVFTKESKYPNHPTARRSNKPCLIGRLDDVELQFIHYSTAEEAKEKWERRKSRIDHTKLYFILAFPYACDPDIAAKYVEFHPERKVCFHHRKGFSMQSCVYIPSSKEHIGNLYSQYHRFVGRFDFADWILNPKTSTKCSTANSP